MSWCYNFSPTSNILHLTLLLTALDSFWPCYLRKKKCFSLISITLRKRQLNHTPDYHSVYGFSEMGFEIRMDSKKQMHWFGGKAQLTCCTQRDSAGSALELMVLLMGELLSCFYQFTGTGKQSWKSCSENNSLLNCSKWSFCRDKVKMRDFSVSDVSIFISAS